MRDSGQAAHSHAAERRMSDSNAVDRRPQREMSSLSTSGPRSGALDLSQHLRRTAATYARASVRCRRRVIVEFSRRVFEIQPR